MNSYEWLDKEFNNSVESDIGFTQLVATHPQVVCDDDFIAVQDRLKLIHTFQDTCIEIFKGALDNNDIDILRWLINETPDSLGIEYHRKLNIHHFTRPVFFRTDETSLGKIAEIQCPGSHWGELELLFQYYSNMGYKFKMIPPSKNFYLQLKKLLYGEEPIVCYLTDNSSSPPGVRYFIKRTRPSIKYFGYDKGISSLDCNFIRTHSFFGLCGENYFKERLKQSSSRLKFDFPPNVLFDQKATLVLPFWSRTRNKFSDEIRNIFLFSTPILSDAIELEEGTTESIDAFSKRPQSRRRYYLKYAGSDVSINWGSRAVFRLSNESSGKCYDLLKKCVEDAKKGRIWLLQKEDSGKKQLEYLDRNSDIRIEKMNVKYSAFYGPYNMIGVLAYYRKHFKVHGQPDTCISLLYCR